MSCNPKLKFSVVAVLAALGAQIALAEEQTLSAVNVQGQAERADGPVQGYRATRSATFTKTDTPLKEVPASVSVVPAELMKDQAMESMADVLRYVPGATAHQGEGNRDQVVLRGNSTTADFYVDGVRDDAQIFRDLYNLERVEVLKGPGGMIFGRGGAGGVINRVTKKPVFGHVGEASVTLGSWSQLRGTVDMGEKLNDSAAWRLNVMAEGADSFRDGADLKRYAVNPSVTFLLSPETALTLSYEHAHDERTADRGVPSQSGRPFNADRSTFFGNPQQSDSKITVDSLSAVLEHDFGGGIQVKNSFRVAEYDKFYQNVYPGSAVNAAGNMTLSAYNNANQRTNVFNQTDVTAKFNAAGFEHTLLAGVELGHQDSTNKRMTGFFAGSATPGSTTANSVSAGNPRFNGVITYRPNGTDADNNVQADIAAAYLQDQVALTKELKLLAGLRFDHFKVKFDDRRTLVAATDMARTDNAWSPRLGLIWSPTAASTYYASYSYAFLPSAEQLSLATSVADLAPEKSTNYEVGGRWDVLPKLTLSAAAFRLDKDDVRSRDPNGGGFFVKTGQQRTEGVELGLQGQVARNWMVYAGYANLDARVTKGLNTGTTANNASYYGPGRKIGLVPEHMLSVWNRFEVGGGWGAGLGVIYQSASYASISNAVKLPGFVRTDGAIYYTFAGGKTRLALNIENLADKKYYPTADGDNNISPGAPRNARLTLSTAF
ncbi:MAG TPA: TonB-dependent siderophore receptor [Rhodocyclaceae bacterium]|nr:TonB-dependent siderophore receptor [Rhodocyclaceae bacterium]